MDTLKIAIVEDDSADRDRLVECLNQYAQEKSITMVLELFTDGEQFLKENRRYSLVFMDIEMPGRNGIEIARNMRSHNREEVLILVTNMVQYAIYGYEVKAVDYIMKPVAYEQLALKMPEYLSMIRRRQRILTIKNREGLSRIKIQDIRYVEIYGHNIMIHMTDGARECYGTLKELEPELKEYGFAKCSQSCLVNLAFVDGIYQDQVKIGKNMIPISRREKKSFLAELTRFDGGYGL